MLIIHSFGNFEEEDDEPLDKDRVIDHLFRIVEELDPESSREEIAMLIAANMQIEDLRGEQNDFNVDRLFMHPSASATYAGSLSASVDLGGTAGPRGVDIKFSVPFQGGLDGIDPATIIKTGENLSATNAFGL